MINLAFAFYGLSMHLQNDPAPSARMSLAAEVPTSCSIWSVNVASNRKSATIVSICNADRFAISIAQSRVVEASSADANVQASGSRIDVISLRPGRIDVRVEFDRPLPPQQFAPQIELT